MNHRKVCFRPPSAELGVVPRILQFFFDVEDTSGNILPNQRFTVLLNPVDNQPPVITNGRIKIDEDGVMVISPDILNVDDPDTDSEELMFEVRRIKKKKKKEKRKKEGKKERNDIKKEDLGIVGQKPYRMYFARYIL